MFCFLVTIVKSDGKMDHKSNRTHTSQDPNSNRLSVHTPDTVSHHTNTKKIPGLSHQIFLILCDLPFML